MAIIFLSRCILLSTIFVGLAQGISIPEINSAKTESKTENNILKSICEPPFQLLGIYCLLIDNIISGTWSEMRKVCHTIGGELVGLQDANKLYEISVYINEQGMVDVSYWVGATDTEGEGEWIWTLDNSSVRMDTPLWGDGGREPGNDSDMNCAILSRMDYHYMHDEDCTFQGHGFICEPQPSNHDISLRETRQSHQLRECPAGYSYVGGTCISTDQEVNTTCQNATLYCEVIGGHLLRINDANFLGDIYDYLSSQGNGNIYWVDGSYDATEDLWRFGDGTDVKRGTPFWGGLFPDPQEPNSGGDFTCMTLLYDYGYHFTDEECTNINRYICQYDI